MKQQKNHTLMDTNIISKMLILTNAFNNQLLLSKFWKVGRVLLSDFQA